MHLEISTYKDIVMDLSSCRGNRQDHASPLFSPLCACGGFCRSWGGDATGLRTDRPRSVLAVGLTESGRGQSAGCGPGAQPEPGWLAGLLILSGRCGRHAPASVAGTVPGCLLVPQGDAHAFVTGTRASFVPTHASPLVLLVPHRGSRGVPCSLGGGYIHSPPTHTPTAFQLPVNVLFILLTPKAFPE